MSELAEYLGVEGCLGVVRSAKGETRIFRQRGVTDLMEMLESEPELLHGAEVADKVIGRGAALLLAKGMVATVYAKVISSGALDVLRRARIPVEYEKEVPIILNRSGDGQCPVERLTASTDDTEEAFNMIRNFLNERLKTKDNRTNTLQNDRRK